MTVPGARGSARRTVRVAVALIAGQAVLCAVIGYLTLGGAHLHRGAGPAAAGPLAGGPLVAPTVQMPPPVTSVAPKPPPVPSTRPDATASAARPSRSAAPDSHSAPVNPSPPPAKRAPIAPPVTPIEAPPSPSFAGPLATPSPTASGVQQNVTVGDVCSPAGADGRTSDGQAVRCVSGADGQLRWALV